jgi:hypothetical protein
MTPQLLEDRLIWLKITPRKRLGLCSGIPEAIAECDELTAIFVSSTRTADENAD